MNDVWTFTILYLGLIAGTLAALAAVIWYLANRHRRASFEDLLAGAMAGEEERAEAREWEACLARLEAKVDRLLATWNPERVPAKHPYPEKTRRMFHIKYPVSGFRSRADDRRPTGMDRRPMTEKERVYLGFLQGKTITDLARETGLGKGEVELIINLRRTAGAGGTPFVN